jgi:hypothetical protein
MSPEILRTVHRFLAINGRKIYIITKGVIDEGIILIEDGKI